MISKTINGKKYTMDEDEFIHHAYVAENEVYHITVLKVIPNVIKTELFSFEIELDSLKYATILGYLITLGITPNTTGKEKIIFRVNHDYDTEYLYPDTLTGKEKFTIYKYLMGWRF